ncbi:alkaline shock response membrane anchor protein AmaP [Catellatospora vulcania]|uniref:alkaline shock response membrane anchor protein AmaP n=1 Tax=Catellatospora vulcania TaxID=1460450 RepID=UPI0012D40618|nr:alkaline shock response membrane anchor protein AmaP [Catellatospora vulcania]
MNVDRFNRIALLVAGLLLLGAGTAGVLAHTDALGWSATEQPLVGDPVNRYLSANTWVRPAAVAAALILLLLAVRWLLAVLLSSDRLRTLVLRTDQQSDEHTTVAATALEGAVRDQIERYRGVTSAKVRLLGKPENPTMTVAVDTGDQGDIAALCERIEHGALADARQVLGRPNLPVRLDLDTRRRQARVA